LGGGGSRPGKRKRKKHRSRQKGKGNLKRGRRRSSTQYSEKKKKRRPQRLRKKEKGSARGDNLSKRRGVSPSALLNVEKSGALGEKEFGEVKKRVGKTPTSEKKMGHADTHQ